jgi:hypothetical protein
VVVLRVLGDVAELAGDSDAICDLTTSLGREMRDLFFQLLVTLWGEDHFLHDSASSMPKKTRGPNRSALAGAASYLRHRMASNPLG